MMETAEGIALSPSHGLGKAMPALSGVSLSILADQQIEDARRGLEVYMDEKLAEHAESGGDEEDGHGTAPQLAASIAVTQDYASRKMALHCKFSGVMTPELYQQIEDRLQQTLTSHPAWNKLNPSISCEQQANGQVCAQVEITGLAMQDYAQLIYSLAERHQANDSHKANRGVGLEDEHQLEEKMRSAEKTLKSMIDREMKEPASKIGVKVKKHKSKKPGKFVLDLRLENAMGRRASDAFAAAFEKRATDSVTGINPSSYTPNVTMTDTSITVDNLSSKELTTLVESLARPLMSVSSSGSNHEGVLCDAPVVQPVLPKGSHS